MRDLLIVAAMVLALVGLLAFGIAEEVVHFLAWWRIAFG